MTHKLRIPTRVATVAVLAALVVPASAAAAGPHAGERSYQETYPAAVKLCNELASGAGPKHLQPYATQIIADCQTLQAGFTSAQTAVLAAEQPLKAQILALRSQIRTSCRSTSHQMHAACVTSRSSMRTVEKDLRKERLLVAKGYYHTLESARVAFWSAVRSFPGGALVKADKPIKPQKT